MIQIGVADVLLLLAIACLLAAALWGVRAIRGARELGPPRCSRCGHDLRTYGAPPTACPECGADCTAPGAISFSRRRRRRADIVRCVVGLALACGLGAGVLLWVTWRISGAAGPAPLTTAEVAARASDGRDVPWHLLPQILRAAPPGAAEREALVARMEREGGAPALDLSAGGRAALNDACATLLRLMDDRERRRLAEAWTGPPVVVMPARIERGRPWTIAVRGRPAVDSVVLARSPEGLLGSGEPFVVAVRVLEVRVGGAVVRSTGAVADAGGSVRIELPSPAGLGPFDGGGAPAEDATVEVELDIEQIILLASDVPRAGLPSDPAKWPLPIAETRTVVRRRVTVVGPGAELVERSVDPSRRDQMDGALRIGSCRIEGDGDRRRLVVETVVVPPGGVHIAGRWRVAIGGRVVELGPIAAWGKPTNFAVDGEKRLVVPLLAEEAPSTIDVAIVPWSGAASSLPRDGVAAWGEVIERRGVPVAAR